MHLSQPQAAVTLLSMTTAPPTPVSMGTALVLPMASIARVYINVCILNVIACAAVLHRQSGMQT